MNLNPQQKLRIQQADAVLEEAIAEVPRGDEIAGEIEADWILNIMPNDLPNFTVQDMNDAIQAAFPGHVLDNQQLTTVYEAFKTYVETYYAAIGGGRRRRTKRTRKHKKHSKKTHRRHRRRT